MRNGFLVSLGLLATTAGAVTAQVPYGYYPPAGYYGYQPAPTPYSSQPAYSYQGNAGYMYGYRPAPQPYGYYPVNNNQAPAGYQPASPVPVISADQPLQGIPAMDNGQTAPQPQPARPLIGAPEPPPAKSKTKRPTELVQHQEDFIAPTPQASGTVGILPDPDAGHGGCGPHGCFEPVPCAGPRIWGSIEGLYWHVKNAPTVPLITTNNDPNTIGALNEPGTAVVVGDKPIDYGYQSGVRGTFGGWLVGNCVGVEGSIFGLPRQSRTYSATSAGFDAPVVAVPINSTATNIPFGGVPVGETTFNNGNVPAVITVNTYTQFWGADVMGLAAVHSGAHHYLYAIGGFQYLDLREGLTLDQTYFNPLGSGSIAVHDGFFTRNQFYGASAGLRGGVFWGPVDLEMTGKIAVGPNREESVVGGSTTVYPGGFGAQPGVYNGGAFAQPSNSGTFSRNEFIVVPQGQVKVSVDVLRSLRLFVAYDYLYMSGVVRAASQIDRNINPTQNIIYQPTMGAPGPLPNLNRTDFWSQGVSAGMEFRF